jgi:predicted transposase/invertase (TIGR01784 family)
MLNNPHDTYFKYSLQDEKLAKQFIKHYLPEKITKQIKLDTLKPSRDTLIDQELKKSYTDMLFTVNLQNDHQCWIYCLFEHKSQAEKYVGLQLLKCSIKIWERHRDEQEKLQVVIPIVIYHGKQEWEISQSFIDLFHKPTKDLEQHVPNYKYLLYDLNKEEVRGDEKLKLFTQALKIAYKRDIMNYAEDLLRLAQYVSDAFFITTLLYLINVNNELDIEKLVEVDKKLKTEKGGVIMTTAERLIQEGIQKGIQEGIQKGRIEGMKEKAIKVARKLLMKGMSIEEVAELTELPEEEIIKLTQPN